MSSKESREFRLHKDILWSIILAQSGTLSKSLLELVCNSVDAGATFVDITLTQDALKVQDDGKGFTSRTEIEEFFETFGTPHTAGDAKFGCFRMGRGQVMAFTVNTWQSGVFVMEVDIKNKGLAYLLSEGETKPGCTISGALYDTLSPSQLLVTAREMEELCKYVDIPVWFNGKRISREMDSEKWTQVDEDAYYLLQPNRTWLEVYNLGVLVCRYHANKHGMGGIISSRKQLNVNFARNDILVSVCPVWKHIASVVKAHARTIEDKGPKQVNNENTRRNQVVRLLDGAFASDSECADLLESAALFTDVTGKHWGLLQLAGALSRFNNRVSVVTEDGNRIADRLQQGKLALVLDSRTLDRFSLYSLPEILDVITDRVPARSKFPNGSPYRYHNFYEALLKIRAAITPFEDIQNAVSDSILLVEVKDLTKAEKQVLSAVDDAQYALMKGLGELGVQGKRALRVMEAEHLQMCTDGESVIYINRNLLKMGGYMGAAMSQFTQLGALLVHEYIHGEADSETHVHSSEFYQQVEQMFCDHGQHFGAFLHQATKNWLALVQKESKRLRSGELKELDRQAQLDSGASASLN